MKELELLTATQRAMAAALMSGASAPKTRYLTALQNVARGYRAPKRTVRIREDRSIVLYPGLGQDRVVHDGLRERIKGLRRDSAHRNAERIAVLQTELDARRAGNPTEGFKI